MTHPDNGGGGTTGPGRVITPLTAEERADRYRRQTGAKELTPRQRRRVAHKANRTTVPARTTDQ